jgi:hypothetical protein
LLGEGLTGVAIPVARVAGIALIALGVACWPGKPLIGMLTYSAVVTLYLSGLRGIEWVILVVENPRKLGIARGFCILAGAGIRHE